MEQEFIRYLVTQGPFAVLFVWLLFYVMRNNKEREMRLHNTLVKFSEKYNLVVDELKEIKDRLPLR